MNRDIVFETPEITLQFSSVNGSVVSAKRGGHDLVLPAGEPFYLQLLKDNGDQILLKGSDFAGFSAKNGVFQRADRFELPVGIGRSDRLRDFLRPFLDLIRNAEKAGGGLCRHPRSAHGGGKDSVDPRIKHSLADRFCLQNSALGQRIGGIIGVSVPNDVK